MLRRGGAVHAVAAGAVLVAVVSGCAPPTTRSDLVGVFEDTSSGARVRLAGDGAFMAEAVPCDAIDSPADDAPCDFGGSWELLDSQAASDVVYLSVDGGLGMLAGVQLYVRSPDVLYFQEDPDGGPSLVLRKVEREAD